MNFNKNMQISSKKKNQIWEPFQTVPARSSGWLLMDVIVAASGQQMKLNLNGTGVHYVASRRL
jgi:hypothetical protein